MSRSISFSFDHLISSGGSQPQQSASGSSDVSGGERGPCSVTSCGTAVADDGNIYGVPSHNRRVVRVVPGTGEVTELGDDDTLGDRKYKFLRGIRTKSGTILGIPAWATSVLEITPATGEVTTIGDLRPPDGNMKKWKWMWHGAAAGLDGNIYGIPSNANEVLKAIHKLKRRAYLCAASAPAVAGGVRA